MTTNKEIISNYRATLGETLQCAISINTELGKRDKNGVGVTGIVHGALSTFSVIDRILHETKGTLDYKDISDRIDDVFSNIEYQAHLGADEKRHVNNMVHRHVLSYVMYLRRRVIT